MFRKIADFFVDLYDNIMEYFFPSRYKIPDYGPMTEEDWEHLTAHEIGTIGNSECSFFTFDKSGILKPARFFVKRIRRS